MGPTTQSKKAVSSIIYSSTWKILILTGIFWCPEMFTGTNLGYMVAAVALIEITHIGGQAAIDAIVRGLEQIAKIRTGLAPGAPPPQALAADKTLRYTQSEARQPSQALPPGVGTVAARPAPSSRPQVEDTRPVEEFNPEP